jgi:hypothetical protein
VTLDILKEDFWYPNLEEFKKAYVENCDMLLSMHHICRTLDFESLAYIFFPVTEEKFMAFHTRKQQFFGWISIEEEELIKEERYSYLGSFSVLKEVVPMLYQAVLREGYQYKKRQIYLVPDAFERGEEALEEFYSLYMLPDVVTRCMKHVWFLPDMESVEQCFTGTNNYLPKKVHVQDEYRKDSIEYILKLEHQKRIQEERENRPQPILTIGIPSYERGERARNLVERLLELPHDYEIQILISNNGSREWDDEYAILKEIQDVRYTYFAFETNQFYYGNIAQVARLATGKWLMYISNEDYIDETQLDAYVEFLLMHEGASMVRPKNAHSYQKLKEGYASKGVDAISLMGFMDNYLSGNTYNRRFLTNECVNQMEAMFLENISYKVYTHSLYTIKMCTMGDVYNYPLIVIQEGIPEEISESASEGAIGYKYYENRVEQWLGNVEFANKLPDISEDERVYIYLAASLKLIHLLRSTNKELSGNPAWEAKKKELWQKMKRMYEHMTISDACKARRRQLVYYNIDAYIY